MSIPPLPGDLALALSATSVHQSPLPAAPLAGHYMGGGAAEHTSAPTQNPAAPAPGSMAETLAGAFAELETRTSKTFHRAKPERRRLPRESEQGVKASSESSGSHK